MAHHSCTRLAMSRSVVEALAPFSDTASSKINLSSSVGRYGPREIVLDIELSKFKIESNVDSPGWGW